MSSTCIDAAQDGYKLVCTLCQCIAVLALDWHKYLLCRAVEEYRSVITIIYLMGFLHKAVLLQSGMYNIKVVSDDVWCSICHSPMVD